MNKAVDIASVFPKYSFWDMDISKLDIDRDKDIIIPRALYASTEETFDEDIENLESFYSRKEILSVLKETKELISNTVCKMVASKYDSARFARFAV